MWWIIGGAVLYCAGVGTVLLFFKGAKMLNEAFDEADRSGQ